MNFCLFFAISNRLKSNALRWQKIIHKNEFLPRQKIPRIIAELLPAQILENQHLGALQPTTLPISAPGQKGTLPPELRRNQAPCYLAPIP
jgi:hypothetical protein